MHAIPLLLALTLPPAAGTGDGLFGAGRFREAREAYARDEAGAEAAPRLGEIAPRLAQERKEALPAEPRQARPRTAPELRTATTHPMRYYVSLPAGWTAEKTWPVAVVIPDATRDFLGNVNAFVKAGRDMPFIFVAPLVLTCGGPYRGHPPYPYTEAEWKEADRRGDFGFDADGIAAALADVRKLYGGEEKYFVTGWEAGGHTTWALVFQQPEALRAAAPVSTNYLGRWVGEDRVSTSPARAQLPVKVLFCGTVSGQEAVARQHCLEQTKRAMGVAEAHGYRNVSLVVKEGRPHGPLAEDVLEFFSSILAAK